MEFYQRTCNHARKLTTMINLIMKRFFWCGTQIKSDRAYSDMALFEESVDNVLLLSYLFLSGALLCWALFPGGVWARCVQVKVIGGLAGNTSVDRGTEFDQHVSYITSMIRDVLLGHRRFFNFILGSVIVSLGVTALECCNMLSL